MGFGNSVISTKTLSDTLDITECRECDGKPAGYWLYDKIQGMNLSMGSQSIEKALVEALTYYQRRLTEVQHNYNDLNAKVNAFVNQFKEENEDSHHW